MTAFKVTLSGDGIRVDRYVNKDVALEILNSILGAGTAAAASTSLPVRHVSAAVKLAPTATPSLDYVEKPFRPPSLRDFISELSPKTNAQIILCIGSYLTRYDELERFERELVRLKFSIAGEPLPKNFTRDFQSAIDKGWIGEARENETISM